MDGRVRDIVQSVIPDSVFIVEIVVRGHQGTRVVEVYLDGDEALGIGQIGQYGRQVGAMMEEEEVIRGQYSLNVSSPGADRPLRVARQFPKHVGRMLAVKQVNGESIKGQLASADSESLVLTVGKEDVRLVFQDIEEAVVVLPW